MMKQPTMLTKLYASHFSEHNSNVKAIYWMMLAAWTQFSPPFCQHQSVLSHKVQKFTAGLGKCDAILPFPFLLAPKARTPLPRDVFPPVATYSFFSHSLSLSLLVDSPIPASGFRFLQTTSDESLVVVATFWCCLCVCAWWKQHADLSGKWRVECESVKWKILRCEFSLRKATNNVERGIFCKRKSVAQRVSKVVHWCTHVALLTRWMVKLLFIKIELWYH